MTAILSLTSKFSQSMLEARAIACSRGERELFVNLNMQVLSGECLHVRGENGVGKTSLLRLLAGLSLPETGDILWDEKLIQEDIKNYHRALFFMGHRDALKDDLTALENLQMYAAIDGIQSDGEAALSALWQSGLRGRENLPVSCLSAGQKKRVLIARMITRDAQVWILDEPFNALDTQSVQDLQRLIIDHLARNGLAILTSHQSLSIPGLKVLDL